jgi:hypothetical protein
VPQSGVRVGRACPTCMRGVLAQRAFHAHEVVLTLPFSTMLRFKCDVYTASAHLSAVQNTTPLRASLTLLTPLYFNFMLA